ncbi:hypothetical protein K435DRAFT_809058 [Dendrothele bispora CBS 962.96]|uniref:Uncharacterized protein n=1 Tax=Dendrothele bispora (strain CBS 962.96) TaxID=1314807 RepID=A0A4S8KZE9_DENBC|nr:hypothetical protein K435DRAFT_809058 [Dendrothele bispora CBS 962.96]
MSNSAAQLLAILCLIDGNKTTIHNRTYAEYKTAIATVDGLGQAAIVCIWQKPGTHLMVDNTCVLTLAKMSVTWDDTPWVLEPVILHPFHSDPNDDEYENTLPDFRVPIMISMGTVLSVTSNAIAPYNAPTKAFVVATSEFVCGSVVTYTLRACFDPASPKWTKVPPPNVGNNVYIVGHIHGVYNNTLYLDVESIVLNTGVGSNNPTLASPASTPVATGKKRKFTPVASSSQSGDNGAENNTDFEAEPAPSSVVTEPVVSDTASALRIVNESQVVSAKVRGKRKEK